MASAPTITPDKRAARRSGVSGPVAQKSSSAALNRQQPNALLQAPAPLTPALRPG